MNNILSIFNCLALFLSSISENCRAAFAQHNFVPPCQTLSLIIQVEFRNHSLPVLDGLFGPATRLSTAIVICVLGASRQPIPPICSHLSIQGNHSRNLRTKDVGRDAKSCYGVFFVGTTVGIPMRGDASWIFLYPSTMFHANPRMKKQLDSVVRKILEDVEFAEVQDYPEFVDLEFSVDIMEPGNSSEINAEGLAFKLFQCPFRAFTT